MQRNATCGTCENELIFQSRDELIFERRDSISNQAVFCSRGVVVITTAQLHSTKPEPRFCADLNPARDVSEIRNGEDL